MNKAIKGRHQKKTVFEKNFLLFKKNSVFWKIKYPKIHFSFYREFNEKSFENTRSFFWCKESENLIKMLNVYNHFNE